MRRPVLDIGLRFQRNISISSIPRSPESVHPHRTRLTNLLWRERFAKGHIYKEGIPLLAAPLNRTASSDNSLFDTQTPYIPKPKRMAESYCEVVLPFRTDLLLREEYVNVFKGLRFGKLMEDLDALAASISYKHAHDGRDGYLPLTIVTASVDRIDLLEILRPDLDLRLCGYVTYVGKSSMEVTIKVESLGDPSAMHRDTIDDSGKLLTKADNGGKNVEWTPLCLGRFTMVAKDFEGKTVQVNPLLLHNDHEKELFQLGAKRKEQKLEAAKQNDLRKQQPNSAERDFLQGMYQELHQYEDGKGAFQKDRLPAGVVMMSDTILDNVKLCHPQERNIHSSIFGGFLMKEAFEIAYTNAMLFTKGRPYTVALDEIAFKKPVPIGSVLLLTSQVVYAEGPPHRTFQVEVTAEIIPDVRNDNEKVVTNVFNYTFASGKENDSSVPRVLPYSYGEFMQTLKAKRRRDIGIQMKKAQLEEFKKYKIIPE